jgi:hypothetical protein
MSSINADLLPTDDDVQFYRDHGWYKSRKVFTDEQIEAARRAQDEFYAGSFDYPALPNQPHPGWTPEHGDVLRKNDHASFRKQGLIDIVRSPIIGAIAARLNGSPSIRLWHDQLLYKPVEQGDVVARVGWHTDYGYWKTCSSPNMLTAWVPFHDCDAEMGTISMIDGSNKWPDNTAHLDFFSNDLEGLEKRFVTGGQEIVKVPIELKAGEISFHHCLTIHGSGPNRSSQPRRSIAVHLQDDANRWQRYIYPDGNLATHDNDSLVRKVDGHPDYTDPEVCPQLWP